MWWAGAALVATGHPRPLVHDPVVLKDTETPTQMAIPLQMENFPEQLVAATRARMRQLPIAHFKE
jgi:hypothetical protein